jgi:membrane protease subunit HflK
MDFGNFNQTGAPDSGVQRPKVPLQFGKKTRWLMAGAILLVLVVFLISSCWYTVNETQQGVLVTFGKVSGITEAGLHFKLPYPIQSVYIVDVNKTQKMSIGYTSTDGQQVDNVNISESKMITGDFNIVNIDFFIEWKISDPAKYIFHSNDPEGIFKNVVQSSARDVVGTKGVDGVLTTEKASIQAEIKTLVIEKLAHYDIGIQVLEVKIQDSEPPTPEVIAAFKSVETAKQERDTYVNQSLAYKNSKIPEAKSEADKILREAESFKERRINEATGQVAYFTKMYEEYAKNKAISKTRMYLETIERILPGVTVYIDATDGSIQKLLPVKAFSEGG